jgi:hypothetical protein
MAIKTERQQIETIQRALASAEGALAKLAKMNVDAGRVKEGTVANLLFHKLHVLHGEMSLALLEHYPDFAAEALTRGPGR